MVETSQLTAKEAHSALKHTINCVMETELAKEIKREIVSAQLWRPGKRQLSLKYRTVHYGRRPPLFQERFEISFQDNLMKIENWEPGSSRIWGNHLLKCRTIECLALSAPASLIAWSKTHTYLHGNVFAPDVTFSVLLQFRRYIPEQLIKLDRILPTRLIFGIFHKMTAARGGLVLLLRLLLIPSLSEKEYGWVSHQNVWFHLFGFEIVQPTPDFVFKFHNCH